MYPARCNFFFFNDTATTEIYTLSLHDALPISRPHYTARPPPLHQNNKRNVTITNPLILTMTLRSLTQPSTVLTKEDRKSTRLNSSHSQISYAVFCLKKKQTPNWTLRPSAENLS